MLFQLLFTHQYSNMGNSLIAQAKKQLKSQNYCWRIKQSLPFSAIVFEEGSKLQGQKYKIQYSLLEDQWSIYVLRKNNPRYLVTVYDIIQDKDSLCSSDREVSVVIQSIPYRLADLGTISFSDAMYILKCLLEGYKKLIKNTVQFYLLDDANICFTKKGHCKFWINQNLYLSKPHSNRIVSQSTFITALLEIVEMRINQVEEQYMTLKAKCSNFTLQKMLEIVNCFHDSRVSFISSISSMKMLYSPSLLSQNNSFFSGLKQMNPEKVTETKVSVSKYTKRNRKNDESWNKYNLLQSGIGQSKKLSLSFNKSRNAVPFYYKQDIERSFVSPIKIPSVSTIKFKNPNSSKRQRKDIASQLWSNNE